MWIQTLTTLSHLFVVLNSSVNFIIYIAKLHILHRPADCPNCRQGRRRTRTETAATEIGEFPSFMHRFRLQLEDSRRRSRSSCTVTSEQTGRGSYKGGEESLISRRGRCNDTVKSDPGGRGPRKHGGESLISRSSRVGNYRQARMRINTICHNVPEIVEHTAVTRQRSGSVFF